MILIVIFASVRKNVKPILYINACNCIENSWGVLKNKQVAIINVEITNNAYILRHFIFGCTPVFLQRVANDSLAQYTYNIFDKIFKNIFTTYNEAIDSLNQTIVKTNKKYLNKLYHDIWGEEIKNLRWNGRKVLYSNKKFMNKINGFYSKLYNYNILLKIK